MLAGVGLIGWFKVQAAQNNVHVEASNLAGENVLTLDYIKEDATIKSELVAAKLQAKSWQQDAHVVAVSIKFEDGLSYGFLKQYNYAFSSEIELDRYLLINNSRISGSSQSYAEKSLFETAAPEVIPEEYLKINFLQALEIAERAGGDDFRIANNGHYGVALLLMQPEGGVLNWYISYYDKQSSSEKNWLVNATSGDLQEG
jgi:hypothetical protein